MTKGADEEDPTINQRLLEPLYPKQTNRKPARSHQSNKYENIGSTPVKKRSSREIQRRLRMGLWTEDKDVRYPELFMVRKKLHVS